MRIIIDSAKCVGAGNCEADLPDVFTVQDVGATKVISVPSEDRRQDLEWVVGNCPTGAISVVE